MIITMRRFCVPRGTTCRVRTWHELSIRCVCFVHTTVICIRGLPGVFLYRLNQRARVEACEGFAILSHIHIRVFSDCRAIAHILTDVSVTARPGVTGRARRCSTNGVVIGRSAPFGCRRARHRARIRRICRTGVYGCSIFCA